MLSAYNAYNNGYEFRWYSAFFAGVWAATILNEGFHVSPSNHQIQGLSAAAGNSVVETDISASLDDTTAETNLLNAVGIITVFNSFGTGIRTWGNRSAAFPSSSLPRDMFLAVAMAGYVLDDSVKYAMLQFIDLPVNAAWIDSVTESVNSFIRTKQQQGAFLDGKCQFLAADNPATEMANGHFTFSYDWASPIPGERITFKSMFNIDYVNNLVTNA
jgi:phage tail sheath protein FI